MATYLEITLPEAVEAIWPTRWIDTDGEVPGCVLMLNHNVGPDALVQLLGPALLFDSWKTWWKDIPPLLATHVFGYSGRLDAGPPEDDPDADPPRQGRRWLYLACPPLRAIGDFHRGSVQVYAADSPEVRGLISLLPDELQALVVEHEDPDEVWVQEHAPGDPIVVDTRPVETELPEEPDNG
jgi:hypothetical protein